MVEVVAALIREEDRVLICKRSEKQSRAGKWEFPGGKIETYETPEAALARECREELAIEVSVGGLVCESRCDYPDISIRLLLYDAQIIRGVPVALEHAECGFVPVGSLRNYTFCGADIPFLKVICSQSDVAQSVNRP